MGQDSFGFSNLGDEIRESVQSALNHGDFSKFSHLNSDVQKTVDQALNELKKSRWYEETYGEKKQEEDKSHEWKANRTESTAGNREAAREGNAAGNWEAAREGNMAGRGNQAENRHSSGNTYAKGSSYAYDKVVTRRPQVPALPVRQVGKVGGILFTVFGSILLGFGILFLLLFSGVGALAGEAAFMYGLALILGLPVSAIGAAMLAVGLQKSKRLTRMNTYLKQIGDKRYCDIKRLADGTGKSVRYLIRDLQKMIRVGMFPEGHLDEKKTTFMLDNKTHQLYLEMMEARKQSLQEEDARESSIQTGEKEREGGRSEEQEKIRAVVREGHDYISQIRQANAAIPGKEISAKLDRLSNIMDKIFLYVEEHPEKLEDLHKFIDYYLPTTLKLVDAYREFDAQPVQGENITMAKREIEETLDTINQAFEKLFDKLYAEAAMDIVTDIDVLEAMFAQEGLTDSSLQEWK